MPANRRDLRRRLFNQAAQHGGYFTASQAKSLGYSYQAQAHHVAAGNWDRVGRGLFRLTEWVPGAHDDLIRWTLWSKGRATVSHETALAVHGIGELESRRTHLTVPPGFTKREDAVVIHQAELGKPDIVEHAGFSVTTAIRSLVDVAAGGVDDEQLARAISEAASSGLLTLRQLRRRAEEIDLKGALHIERAIQRMEVS